MSKGVNGSSFTEGARLNEGLSNNEEITPAFLDLGPVLEEFFGALGDPNSLDELLTRNPELINIRIQDGLSPMHLVSGTFNEDIIKVMIKHGARLDVKDDNGNTPLHYAAETIAESDGPMAENGIAFMKFMISEGADARAQNSNGDTFLHIIASTENFEEKNSWVERGVVQKYTWEKAKEGFEDLLTIKNSNGKTCDDVFVEPKMPRERQSSFDSDMEFPQSRVSSMDSQPINRGVPENSRDTRQRTVSASSNASLKTLESGRSSSGASDAVGVSNQEELKSLQEELRENLATGASEKQRKEKLKEVFDGEFVSAIAAL